MSRAAPPYLTMIDHEFDIRGRACDVLIFGDSTALTGIDPAVIEEQTGLRTCDISQTKGSIGVLEMSALDSFLARNPPPKYLVIQFAPEDFRHFASWGEVAFVEGELQLVRRYPARYAAIQMLHHPNEAFAFMIWVYRATLAAVTGSDRAQTRHAVPTSGHFLLPRPTETRCLPADKFRSPDVGYIQAIKSRYTSNKTQVLLNVSPLPDCDSQFRDYAAKLDNLTDNQLEHYPIELFNDIDRHFNQAGADRVSTAIAGQIQALEQKTNPASVKVGH